MNKKFLWVIVAAALVSGSFYGGVVYGKSSQPTFRSGIPGTFANGQFRMMGTGGRMGGGFIAGQIISKDPSGVTIKTPDGSTKIILIASSTQIVKSTSGSGQDLSDGVEVVITGSSNSDGSLSAQNVQIRPTGSASFGQKVKQ